MPPCTARRRASCPNCSARRYSGVSLGYNLASIFAGALAPLIATGLMAAYSPQTWPISVYMIVLAVITVVSVYYAQETRQGDKA
jgi:MFS transporter, MHS family, shikimate and dehydroshikimate transport protein